MNQNLFASNQCDCTLTQPYFSKIRKNDDGSFFRKTMNCSITIEIIERFVIYFERKLIRYRRMKFFDIIYTIIQIILLPVYLVFFFLFLLIWGLCTITGFGPFLQYIFTLRDRKKLDREKFVKEFPKDIRVISIPPGIHGCSKDKPYKLFAIFSEPEIPSKYPPVCIPNGLGATAVLISQMQERLVEQGFSVLSFDRLGVGMSDPNLSSENPTAVDVVKELDYVMEKVRPGEKWILLGPSMGSIIAQCYISMFPDKVVGFLNMDGLVRTFLNLFSFLIYFYFLFLVSHIRFTCIVILSCGLHSFIVFMLPLFGLEFCVLLLELL